MKKILALTLCLAMTAGLFGCAEKKNIQSEPDEFDFEELVPADSATEAPAEQTLCMAYYPDRSLNPYQCTDYTNRALFPLLYQGLFSIDREYNVEAVLCSRYVISEDMQSYVFYPNPKASFSDGSSVTAEDIVASLQAASKNAYYEGRFTHFVNIALTKDGGAGVELNTPYENLPLLLDIPIVKASQVGAASPLGTGPYEFANTVGGVKLHKRFNWWCSAYMPCHADSVELVTAQSNSQIRDQFEFYDVGLVCTDPCTDTYADFRCDYELWDCENGMMLYLGCNMESKVFSVPGVRKTLTYAIDREKIAEKFYRRFGRPITLPASPQFPWYSESLAGDFVYEPDRFKSALKSANLAGMEIKLLVNKDDSLRTRTADFIGEMLTKAGLNVKVVAESTNTYIEDYKWGNYDLHLGQTRLSPNMDLSVFFAPWGPLSYNGMDDAAIYDMCLKALENSGNYLTMFQMVMNDGRLCPVISGGYAIYADRGRISDLTPARDNVFYYSLGTPASDIQEVGEVKMPEPPEETSSEEDD